MEMVHRIFEIYRQEGFITLLMRTYEHFKINLQKIIKPYTILLFRHYITRLVPVKQGLILGLGTHRQSANSIPTFKFLSSEDYSGISVVWLADNQNEYDELSEVNQAVVLRDSLRGKYLRLRADVIFTDGKDEFHLNCSTTVVRMFHEFPVKYGPKAARRREQKTNLSSFDYQLTTSDFCSEKLLEYKKAHQNGDDLSRDIFISLGFPTEDKLIDVPTENVHHWEQFLRGDVYRTTILYAPTKRKEEFVSGTEMFPFDDFDIDSLKKLLEDIDGILLIRYHPSEADLVFGEETNQTKLVHELCKLDRVRRVSFQDFDDVNDILPFIDVLVTDYSSIYHSYLLLDRPMLFIPYDYHLFEREVGFKYNYFENLPGPVINSFQEFGSELTEIGEGKDKYHIHRAELREKIHKYTDGKSAERVAEFIINL